MFLNVQFTHNTMCYLIPTRISIAGYLIAGYLPKSLVEMRSKAFNLTVFVFQ